MKRRIEGFSLIELLIATLVLSIGLLGLASLQATLLKGNRIAHMRSIAAEKAYELADLARVYGSGFQNNASFQQDYQLWKGNLGLPGGDGQICRYQSNQRDSHNCPYSCCSGNSCSSEDWVVQVWWREGDRTPNSQPPWQCFAFVFRP